MRLVLVFLLALVPVAQAQPPLEVPFQVMADGQAVDVPVGHAAPCVADVDRDGLPDLLVGQFGEGRLRIYRNVGEPGAPAFKTYRYLEAGGAMASVPAS
jgi:hypothetical protein